MAGTLASRRRFVHGRAMIARLYLDQNLSEGAKLDLAESRAHYLRQVLRLPTGADLLVFNASSGEFAARLEHRGRHGAIVLIGRRLRDPRGAEPDTWLLAAAVKRAPFDWMVEKATELGATRITPVLTKRAVVDRVRTDRLRAIAVEAAEQCRRLDVPTVDEAQPIDRILGAWSRERLLLWGDETGAGASFRTLAEQRAGATPAWLVGPEGGFAESELDALRGFEFAAPVSLGERILRAETAAITGLVLLREWFIDNRTDHQAGRSG